MGEYALREVDDALDDGGDGLDDLAATPTPEAGAQSSVIEALKAQRQRVAADRSFDVVVPGWGDLLVLRLGSITGKQQAKISDRAQRTSENVNAAFLVAAFRSAWGRTSSSGELTMLADEDGDPFGLDKRLADALDLGPVSSAREVLELLFARANSPTIAITSASNEWLEWARSESDEIDEDFLGES